MKYIGYIPNKIRELRKQRGYSQTQLAQLCNIPQSTFYRLENGLESPLYTKDNKTPKPFVKNLTSYLQASFDELFPELKETIRNIQITPSSHLSQYFLDTSQSPEETITTKLMYQKIQQCISKLPTNRQQVLELRMQGYTLEEIAQQKNRSRERISQLEDEGKTMLTEEIKKLDKTIFEFIHEIQKK